MTASVLDRAVPVVLAVDRSADRTEICAMIWVAADDDPRLLESRTFQGEGALRVWLAGLVAKYGHSNIRVNWTEELRADEPLAVALEKVMGAIRSYS
jgi:hypothetical protein